LPKDFSSEMKNSGGKDIQKYNDTVPQITGTGIKPGIICNIDCGCNSQTPAEIFSRTNLFKCFALVKHKQHTHSRVSRSSAE
jgi:hypothetical protein